MPRPPDDKIKQRLREVRGRLAGILWKIARRAPLIRRFIPRFFVPTSWFGDAPPRCTPLPAATFADLEKYCLFIGYPYSGHSIIGAILSAHPEAVVSNELRDFRYLWEGAAREELFTAILERDRQWSEDGCIGGGGYSYAVPGQWQGRYSKLRVIGDKGGGRLSEVIAKKDPRLLEKMRSWVGLPLRLVHITRNPYDTIATMYARLGAPPGHFERDLDGCIRRYLELAASVHQSTKDLPQDELLILRHEDFIARPRDCIGRLCRFIGLDYNEEYLNDCASIVYADTHKSRTQIHWPQRALADVKAGIGRYPRELGGYRFSDGRPSDEHPSDGRPAD